jgi:hypothetical protein
VNRFGRNPVCTFSSQSTCCHVRKRR